MPFIYSTLTSPVKFATYTKSNSDLSTISKYITIPGGAHLITRRGDTPPGSVIEVTEDQLTFLTLHPVFTRMVDRGFLRVVKTEERVIEKITRSMETKDASAPETEASLEKLYAEKKGAKLLSKAKEKELLDRG